MRIEFENVKGPSLMNSRSAEGRSERAMPIGIVHDESTFIASDSEPPNF